MLVRGTTSALGQAAVNIANDRARGHVRQAGFLGGLGPVEDFLPVFDPPSGVQFSFFGSFEIGSDAYPLSSRHAAEVVSPRFQGRSDT